MDTLLLTRARYRRRYGNDAPESSMPSRFLEEVPARLIEDLSPQSYGGAYATPYPQRRNRDEDYSNDSGYSYEDESQDSGAASAPRNYAAQRFGGARSAGDKTAAFFGKGSAPQHNSGYKPGQPRFPARPGLNIPAPTGRTGLGQNARVRHPKYGEGIIIRREGDGDDAKLTVQFSSHGMKKLVEKFAQLERL
jgi:DNA helicase-2/ATP-dependent DNA helicase PcrA